MDDPGPGLDGACVVALDHPVHPQHLAAQVDVVGPGLGARSDESLAVPQERSDRREHAPGALGHRRQRGVVVAVGHHERGVRRRADLVAHRVELGPVPPCHRPAHVTVDAVPLGEVLGDEATREAGRPEDDDVELWISAHGFPPDWAIGCHRERSPTAGGARCDGSFRTTGSNDARDRIALAGLGSLVSGRV